MLRGFFPVNGCCQPTSHKSAPSPQYRCHENDNHWQSQNKASKTMKTNLISSSWVHKLHLCCAIGLASASLPSSYDRSATLLKNRPPGKFRLTSPTPNAHRHLQSGDYSTIDGYSCFRNLQGMTDAMFDLEKNYPDLASVSDIGDSYLKSVGDSNGHDIYVLKITASTSSDPAQVFFTGGQHAREYAPPELLMRFAERLVEGYGEDADVTWVLDTTQINIVFYTNPDGRTVAETEPDLFWRKNVNPGDGSCPDYALGTDLNRNYEWMWGDTSGASDDPCAEDYFGTGPASEPEVQAVIAYAKTLFPEGQRKADPMAEIDVPFGEDITGVYMDFHSSGGLTYYPWGYADVVSPDNDSLEALGRKLSYFNGYVLWAGGQPDFLYAATGDASDNMYAYLGVASLGLEIGDAFYEDCDNFETKVYPDNLNSMMYVIKLARKPNSLAKGPDIFDLTVTQGDREITVSAEASDSELVNIDGYPSFTTGEQTVSKVELYLDTLPSDYGEGDVMYLLQPTPVSGSDKVFIETQISTSGLSSGRHALYAVATDSDGYVGPISSVFFDVENVATSSPIEPTAMPTIFTLDTTTAATTTFATTTSGTTELVTAPPSNKPSVAIVTNEPTDVESSNAPSNKPSTAPVTAEPTSAAPVAITASPSPLPSISSTSTSTVNSTSVMTEQDSPSDTAVGATLSPSITTTQNVGTSSLSLAPTPSEVSSTQPSSSISEIKSAAPSQLPVNSTLNKASTEASEKSPENAAVTVTHHAILAVVFLWFNYLL
eukprot:CCRYP_015106-RA/>CCRYP_015106-RA protein AED:0.03 eAED:0.03 QI:9/1/1/1/1/1/3/600/771